VSKSGHHVKDLISDTNIEIQDLTFNSFVSWDGKQYAIRPPFDCILLENRTDVFIVCSEEISFRIEEIKVKSKAASAKGGEGQHRSHHLQRESHEIRV
jgi:hypothetical protein